MSHRYWRGVSVVLLAREAAIKRSTAAGRRSTWPVAAGIAVLLTVGACGPSRSPRVPSPTPDSASSTTSSSVTSSPSHSQAPEYPNLSRFVDPLDRFAYKSAYSDCHLIGVAGTADAYGGDPNEPSSVARAYAVAIFAGSESIARRPSGGVSTPSRRSPARETRTSGRCLHLGPSRARQGGVSTRTHALPRRSRRRSDGDGTVRRDRSRSDGREPRRSAHDPNQKASRSAPGLGLPGCVEAKRSGDGS